MCHGKDGISLGLRKLSRAIRRFLSAGNCFVKIPQPIIRHRFARLEIREAIRTASRRDCLVREFVHQSQIRSRIGQEKTILCNPFSHVRICRIGKFGDKSFANLFVSGAVTGHRQQCRQRVVAVVVGQLILQNQGGVGCGLPPSPSTAHQVNPLNQQIHARGLGDERWCQYSVEKFLCLDKFFLGRQGANHTVQINQGFRVLISLLARDGQGFAVNRFCLWPLARGFQGQTQLAQRKH